MNTERHFPLGVPTNRPAAAADLRKDPRRPDWWIDARGGEHYIQPTKKSDTRTPGIGGTR